MSSLGQTTLRPADLLRRPHLTEKASQQQGAGPVYTFLVAPAANKALVARAIQTLYKVKPLRVNLINLPAKRRLVRGRVGYTAAKRKAVVYLRVGDKID